MVISIWIILLIAVVVVFDFLNGFNDSGDLAASIISSRSMSARTALALAGLAGFIGPFVLGVAVARTIGESILVPEAISLPVLLSAMIGATLWSLFTWSKGIPSSSSHSLLGGLIGAVVISSGLNALMWKSIIMVLVSLFLSPIAGLLIGWLFMKVIQRLLKKATPRANLFFKTGQIPTAIALGLGNGANDAQKTIGIITTGLLTAGYIHSFYVPLWVILLCAGTRCIGTFIGGWRVIRRMGTRFYKIKPVHSFTSQLSSSFVIITSSLFGAPVSTTQIVNMSIMGAGAGERISKVRWLALKEILLSWMFTIPLSAIFAALISWLFTIFTR